MVFCASSEHGNNFRNLMWPWKWFPWSLQVTEMISVVTSINGKFALLVQKTIQDETMVFYYCGREKSFNYCGRQKSLLLQAGKIRMEKFRESMESFEAKPRRYLEFETCSNPSKCGYHCTQFIIWAYFCSPLYTMQHKTFSQFYQCGQPFFHIFNVLSTLVAVRTMVVLTASTVSTVKIVKKNHCSNWVIFRNQQFLRHLLAEFQNNFLLNEKI